MSAAAPRETPPLPAKLRTVLDYLPCDACLQEPSPEQDLLCSVCHRLDRTVTAKRVERRTIIVVRPAPPAAEPVIEPPARAPLEAEEEPQPEPPQAEPAEAEVEEPLAEPEPEPQRPALPRVLIVDRDAAQKGPRGEPGVLEVFISSIAPPLPTPEPAPVVAPTPEPAPVAEPVADPDPEPEPVQEPEPEPEPLQDAEDEDDDALGFGVAGAEDDDPFEWVGRADSATATDETAPVARAPAPAAAEAEDEDFDDHDFVFTPARRREEVADDAAVADEPLAADDLVGETSPDDDDGRSPWARPAEDDWLMEGAPETPEPAEEPWPEESESPAAADAGEDDDDIVETTLVEEDESPADVPNPEETWNLEGLTDGPPRDAEPADAAPEEPAAEAPAARDDWLIHDEPADAVSLDEDDDIVEMSIVEDEAVEEAPAAAAPEAPVAPAASRDFALADLADLKDADSQRLAEAGVQKPSDLSGRDPWQLADQTGISAKRLEKWIWTTELVTVAGVPPAHADALVRSGVRGLDGLQTLDAETGARDVNALKAADAPDVTADDVAQWKRRA